MRNSQPIWIDAICINQLDEREKISQIQLMCNIYRGATKVWAWIGNAVEATVEIISLMPRIISLRKDLQTRVTMEVVTKPEVLQLPPLTSPVWAALHNIVSSPWFDRLWILQEAALAGDISILCGRHVIEWNVLWNIMDMSILLSSQPCQILSILANLSKIPWQKATSVCFGSENERRPCVPPNRRTQEKLAMQSRTLCRYLRSKPGTCELRQMV